MKIKDLKEYLAKLDDDAEVLLFDDEHSEYYSAGAWLDEVYIHVDEDENITFKADVFDVETDESWKIEPPKSAKKMEVLIIEAHLPE